MRKILKSSENVFTNNFWRKENNRFLGEKMQHCGLNLAESLTKRSYVDLAVKHNFKNLVRSLSCCQLVEVYGATELATHSCEKNLRSPQY